MWPMYVDYTDDECRKVLRSLELEAYASMVNAFRAQGTLTKDKKKLLQDIMSALSIPTERHRAEIRRAVNDEHLNTIAEKLCGPNTSTEWAIEGRRLVPLMPRLVPQTLYTAIADSAAHAQAAKNATLPPPGKTGIKQNNENKVGESMASRKRKESPVEIAASPQKFIGIENQYPWNTHDGTVSELSPTCLNQMDFNILSEPIAQIAPSLSDFKSTNETSSTVSTGPSISTSTLIKTTTETTFSSCDQLASNLLSSKFSSVSFMATQEDHNHNSEAPKSFDKLATLTTSASSNISKSSSLLSSSSERLPLTLPSSGISSNKFLTQLTKNQNPKTIQSSNVGLKLTSPINPQNLPPKTTALPLKQEKQSHFLPKKQSVPDNQISHSPISTINELQSLSKSNTPPKYSVTRSVLQPTTQATTALTTSTTAKITSISKSISKPTTPVQQYANRPLFSSAKTISKNISPVIFNVSSSPSSNFLHTPSKTTAASHSEPSKVTTTAAQLLPKSTTIGLGQNQFKINTSSAQTFHYRNEGGVMRSARIVSIPQSVGSRFPSTITQSAISALGITSNLPSGTLRVTLPPGTLTTSSVMRNVSAAKPNVIVVHKAQMWPRSQGTPVLMNTPSPLPKLTNEPEANLTQKLEKNRVGSAKIMPRPLTPAKPKPPTISTNLKMCEIRSPAPLGNKNLLPEKATQKEISTTSENLNEAQCKRNLLADVIEASGILFENSSDKKSKNDGIKKKEQSIEKETKNLQECHIIASSETGSKNSQELKVQLPDKSSEAEEIIEIVSIIGQTESKQIVTKEKQKVEPVKDSNDESKTVGNEGEKSPN